MPAEGKIAAILGASEFPRAPQFNSHPAFKASATEFHRYLRDAGGLGIAKEDVLDLFDSALNVIEQSLKLIDFLKRHPRASDLLIYYVGHGGFLPGGQYFLALRSIIEGSEYFTGLRPQGLAIILNEN